MSKEVGKFSVCFVAKTVHDKKKSISIDGAALANYLRETGLPIPELPYSINLVKAERNTLVFEWTETAEEAGLK